MGKDRTDGSINNYRDWHYYMQSRLYTQFITGSDNRDLKNDLLALPGTKDSEREFKDTWFNVFPARRRPRRAYPNDLTSPFSGFS